jgi:DnaJ-class molecular chaperone
MGLREATSAAHRALTRCTRCRGRGEVEHYTQDANQILDRRGRVVAETSVDTWQKCPECGGRGTK